MSFRQTAAKILVPAFAGVCVWPTISSGLALLLGLTVALTLGNPWLTRTRALTPSFLSYSVVGLGAGMNLLAVAKAGASGLVLTVVSISMTMGLGLLLGRLFSTEKDTSVLISAGTAICGGSAIAAVGPAIGAKPQQMSVALGTVFLLNATALFLFPPIGRFFALSQESFGVWAALAIHDTSSVVGATLQYGPQALAIGTTVKLARALWIVPLTWLLSLKASVKAGTKPKRPWFILGFLVMAALVSWVPGASVVAPSIEWVARRGLVVTLFLIGVNLNRETLREVGLRPLLQGVLLWLLVSLVSLLGVTFFRSP